MLNLPRRTAHPSHLPAIVLLAVAAILFAGCASAASPSPSGNVLVPGNLVGTTWRAILIRDAAPVVGAEPVITFEVGNAGGTTGCNSFGGAYTLAADGAFTMGAMMMTEMACDGPRGAQEGVVVDILSHANRLELVDGQMKISGPSGSIVFAEDPR